MILDYIPLVAGILSLALAVTVLTNGASKRNVKWPFAIFAGSVGIWAIAISCFRLTGDYDFALLFASVYYVAALYIVYGLLLFSFYYSGIKTSAIMAITAMVPAVILSIIVLIPDLFMNDVQIGQNNTVALVPSAYFLYVVTFVVYALLSLGMLWAKAFRAHKKEHHPRVLAIWLSLSVAGGAIFNLFLPWIGNYSLITVGTFFVFPMVGAIFYAIARHGLFDIKLAVIRTSAYVLTLTTLVGVYLIVVFVIFDQFLGHQSTLDQTILNVSLTLVLSFVFQPIKIFFDKWTNRLFYKDAYNPDDFYAALNKVLTSTTDLSTLLRRASQLIAQTLKSEQAHFYIYAENMNPVMAGTTGFRKIPVDDIADIDEQAGNTILVAEQTEIAHVKRMMASHRLAIIMPLRHDQTSIGFLCLGEHRTSRYNSRDIRVLQTISDELVIAIQNALSVQEVKNLNAHLEQRIESATRELRASNAQLHRLDEAKDEFISMASHQLRTPLTSIKGYISMLMEGDVGKVTNEQKHLLSEAFIGSERMVRLIGDFLNVSRLQTGKFVIDRRPVDLGKLVQEEIDSLEPTASARGLSFDFKRPKNLPSISIDENKIQQVIMNFSDNALYYSKESSKIKVSLKVVDDCIEFTVKDTGIGVPEAQQDQLFTKFFRATNARKQRPDGTGVGLFLAKKVIDAHGGEILFTSKENKGSTFGFRLPLTRS